MTWHSSGLLALWPSGTLLARFCGTKTDEDRQPTIMINHTQMKSTSAVTNALSVSDQSP